MDFISTRVELTLLNLDDVFAHELPEQVPEASSLPYFTREAIGN